VLARVLTIVGIVLAVISLLSNYVKREALDEDQFRETARALVADDAIREQLAASMVETLYTNVDVSAELGQRLPEELQPLAGPIAGLTRELSDRAARELLERPRVQALFVGAASAAQQQLNKVLGGDTTVVQTTDGKVVLDIRPLVLALGERFPIAQNLGEQVPPERARIVILDSDQLELAQDVTDWLKAIANWVWILVVLAWAGAVWLARGRRRLEVRAIAIGLVVTGLAVVALRAVLGDYLVDQLVASDSVRPATENAWAIITGSLADAGWSTFGVGLLALIGIWFAGPGRRARVWREELAPYLRRADVAYGALIVLFLLALWLLPVVQFRNTVIVGVLAAIGLEVLRRQTLREFPNAVAPENLWDHLRSRQRRGEHR
jgi:hypothetical protein